MPVGCILSCLQSVLGECVVLKAAAPVFVNASKDKAEHEVINIAHGIVRVSEHE